MSEHVSQNDSRAETAPLVLLVDDCTATRIATAIYLERMGIRTESADTVAGCLERIQTIEPRILLTDYLLPDGNGVDLARTLKERLPSLIVYLITGWQLDSEAERDASGTIDRMLTKPINPGDLVRMLIEDAKAGSSHQSKLV
jgi:CheY-like chemotaxis protein